jgi:4-hydroxybenzoyl-CoA thioesterase
MTPYRSQIQVRFAHCDLAGIVFYPRYIEMFNNLVEDWCHATGVPYAEIHDGRGTGLPVVHLEVDFAAPSRMGEILSATLSVRAVGVSSLTIDIVLEHGGGSGRCGDGTPHSDPRRGPGEAGLKKGSDAIFRGGRLAAGSQPWSRGNAAY